MFWSVPRDWPDETAFLICGGPSVKTQNLEALRGCKVLVVNSSCLRVPWADILFYGDERWGRTNGAEIADFRGLVLSTLDSDSGIRKQGVNYLRIVREPGLADDRDTIRMRHTSAAGAINVLVHLGVKCIVALGLDGGPDANGAVYHHAPHDWIMPVGVWDRQRKELAALVEPLKARGVQLLNASPISRLPFWPRVALESCL